MTHKSGVNGQGLMFHQYKYSFRQLSSICISILLLIQYYTVLVFICKCFENVLLYVFLRVFVFELVHK